jgi:UDP-N-acetyl-D-glucosamine dehydrogenase
MTELQSLRRKIENGSATVGIIGLGYVGLPLAATLHDAGLRIIGFDIDAKKIEALAKGESYIKHLGDNLVKTLSQSERFSATGDMRRLGEPDVVIVCVPTPLGKHQEPDLSYVTKSAAAIGRTLRPGQLVILESTTYPGTTRGDFLPAMLDAAKEAGKSCTLGKDVFVSLEASIRPRQNSRQPSTPRALRMSSRCLLLRLPKAPSSWRTSSGPSTSQWSMR